VGNLLFVALVKSMARLAGVESIKTDEQMFHIRVRGGTTEEMRRRVDKTGLPGILTGPNQVRIDRVTHARDWQPALIRVLRAMRDPEREPAATAAAG
jgi:hypothetical protein